MSSSSLICGASRELVFVNSMSDLFHQRVPNDFIQDVFSIMADNAQHTFQILTKRSHRLKSLGAHLDWSSNVWMGVSIESDPYVFRAAHLREVPATVRFLSIEPMLGPITNLDLEGIHWVIVGGESGLRARPMDISWVRELRDQCVDSAVPFFFKQWGGQTPNRVVVA